MAKKKNSPSGQPAVPLPLDWRVGEDVVSRPVTNLTVQCSEHEVILSFFESRPPVVIGPPETVMAAMTEMRSIPALCVARVIFPATRLQEFAEALRVASENYQRAKESMAGIKPSNGATK